MKRKKLILILAIIVLVVCICTLFIFRKNKSIDFKKLEEELSARYDDLRVFDQYDISMYFGIDSDVLSSSLFMSDYNESGEDSLFDPDHLIIVIDSKDSQNYYDILSGFINSNINNRDINSKLNLYTEAIFKKKKNLVYLILGSNKEQVEKVLKKYL